MYTPKNANARRAIEELRNGWEESFVFVCAKLPTRLRDGRSDEVSASRVLKKLDKEQAVKSKGLRKSELFESYKQDPENINPRLTPEEESRKGRNEEMFYGLLVKWGVYEPITEDDLLDE
jgi:hypothetical protein